MAKPIILVITRHENAVAWWRKKLRRHIPNIDSYAFEWTKGLNFPLLPSSRLQTIKVFCGTMQLGVAGFLQQELNCRTFGWSLYIPENLRKEELTARHFKEFEQNYQLDIFEMNLK